MNAFSSSLQSHASGLQMVRPTSLEFEGTQYKTLTTTSNLALAIYYEDLIRQGHVHDYAEIAALGHVTRARVTQIMNLRLLAPDLQERLLF